MREGNNDMSEGDKNSRPLKIVIVNKSDSTGGAAVVSRRLMEAFREEGIDARMLVVEKLTGSPYVEVAAQDSAIKKNFLLERLRIFIANGFNRSTLFKIDTASDGLPLWRHPLVREADAVLLNWVNQGMLSLNGVRKILGLGKPVVWTMHDMWCMTGICHHAGECLGYLKECGCCPLLGKLAAANDLSRKTWLRKSHLGDDAGKMAYVAVSNWLAEKASASSLLSSSRVEVIPNVFRLDGEGKRTTSGLSKIRLLFGAARLDDPIKGLPVLVEMTRSIRSRHPELADRLELITFGNVKDPASMEGIAIPHRHLGTVSGEKNVREVYESADILVSASSYETLPGTLVEAQAYGCIPVSFNRGGQSDIISHLHTGYLADYADDLTTAALNLADGVAWAAAATDNSATLLEIRTAMRNSVKEKFSPHAIVSAYINLISKCK